MQGRLLLTAIWTYLVIQNGVQLSKALATRQPGYLDFDNLPETNFTCEGKVIGGYYADIETGCQMFHVCTIGQKGDMTDIKFLCLNGTVFDQETRVCERVDEVDCSKSKDFYDLNLDLYNNGFGQEEDSGNDSQKEEEDIELDEELYDENYDSVETPKTSPKNPSTTSTTTSTTTTTTTTTTLRPIVFSSIKPTFNIILPNLKNKSPGPHITGILSTMIPNKNIGTLIGSTAAPSQPPPSQQPESHYPKNVGPHLTGLIPTKNIQITQTQRPFGFVTTQNYNEQQYKQPSVETDLKPPSSYKPYTTSTYKPPLYDPYKNHFFSSSTPTPLTPIFINGFSQKPKDLEEIRSQEQQSKRPVVVLSHHFPTITPLKGNYDEFTSYSSPTGPAVHPFIRQKNRPHVGIKIHPHQHPYLQQIAHRQQQQHHQHQHLHKPNPTILALQSQQQKVHRLHKEGHEIAEHQIAQIASRNAEISNLRSQQRDEAIDRQDNFEPQPSHRETKEIRSQEIPNFGKPAIAIVTSTSSTSSRVQKPPVITVQAVSSVRGKPVINRINYKPEAEYKTELEKLFSNTEVPEKEEQNSDMDLEQLLLAWKLKTNQEVTKEDIENVFARLDTSKFKNGQTISLSDIFNLMSNDSEEIEEETTRIPPMSYDDYTEEDVPYDPFYKDVPKVSGSVRQKREAETESPKSIAEPVKNKKTRNKINARLRTQGKSDFNSDQKLIKRPKEIWMEQENSQVKKNATEGEKVEATTSQRPFPETGFSCVNKVPGGLYADPETDCQLFHICSVTANGSLINHRFFCGNGTKFNQRSRTCQAEELVDCKSSEKFYYLNMNLGAWKDELEESVRPHIDFEPSKIKS